MSSEFRRPWRTLLERDLDLTLLDLLHTSPPFSHWLFQRTVGSEITETAKFRAAWHSVIGLDGRESDLEVEWELDGHRVRLLVEDKIDAACQPDQALSYKHRASNYVHEGAASRCATVLIAPDDYSERHKEDTIPFDHIITLESIQAWAESEPTMSDRSTYLTNLLSAMVGKFKRVRFTPSGADTNVVRTSSKPHFPALYEIIRAELHRTFPHLGITNRSPGEWVYFSFSGKGRGASIRYRARDHWVELVLPRKSFDEDLVSRIHSENPPPASHIAQRGGTELAIWTPTEEIDLDTDLEIQRDKIRGALATVANLASWFGENAVRLTPHDAS